MDDKNKMRSLWIAIFVMLSVVFLLLYGIIIYKHRYESFKEQEAELDRRVEEAVKQFELEYEREHNVTQEPTATPTLLPTATPVPTSTPTPTPSPTPSPTPEPTATPLLTATPSPTATPVQAEQETVAPKRNVKGAEETGECDSDFVLPEYTMGLEHNYYYVLDAGQEFHLDNALQDYLYGLLYDRGREEWFEVYMAQLYLESAFNPNEISKTNDYGIAQINVCNHKWLRKQYGITDFLDPWQSIYCQVIMMEDCWKYEDVERALICYNRGTAKGYTSTAYSRAILRDVELLHIKEAAA